ncbi:HpcH/HpaI aldolase family protein [Halorubrum cibi]|uniref:2-dehydro-3-deoxyglucarate aldolase/4-hydroxy-2-oxoheptanedioate aldolase n=1 Tax=Halorubrum cibi TaxID=413815 RepID=A0A521CCU6_9EURY|nr:aldolase/citrate lyase family protein [Halorubrum cibi]SMO56580.1 2-dehydro-3-deoxyglucarate aldolase/4-hydroxy-2-oxoheptanedioate aldolase [Halorubrum cibi]
MDLKRKLAEGDRPVGGWCALPSPGVAEALATADFDFVTVDTEHSATTAGDVEDMLRAIEAAPGDAEALVRVADVEPARIKRVLDAGPSAIMAPQINSPAAARELVELCRYPPQVASGSGDEEASADPADRVDSDGYRGRRGVAGSRASDFGRRLDGYLRSGADDIAVIAQIETPRAVESAGEIAAVPGIDALFVGPADLSTSLGRFGEYDDPAFADAIAETIGAANDEGVPVGTLATSDELIDRWVEAGYDYLIAGTDIGFLSAGADRAIERYEENI